MIRNAILFLFILVFSIFALNYFHMLPSDKILGFNNINFIQEKQINSFNIDYKKEALERKHPFTSRVSKQK